MAVRRRRTPAAAGSRSRKPLFARTALLSTTRSVTFRLASAASCKSKKYPVARAQRDTAFCISPARLGALHTLHTLSVRMRTLLLYYRADRLAAAAAVWTGRTPVAHLLSLPPTHYYQPSLLHSLFNQRRRRLFASPTPRDAACLSLLILQTATCLRTPPKAVCLLLHLASLYYMFYSCCIKYYFYFVHTLLYIAIARRSSSASFVSFRFLLRCVCFAANKRTVALFYKYSCLSSSLCVTLWFTQHVHTCE